MHDITRFVYILRSLPDPARYYVGLTADSSVCIMARQNLKGGRLNRPRSIDMRIVQTAVLTLLVAAVPSVGFAQTVMPSTKSNWVDHLDHTVPIATVTRAGDPLALMNPQQGDGFVIGAAKLDLKDPDHPMIVFTVGNGGATPIPLSSVRVEMRTVNARVEDDGALLFDCGYGGYLTNLIRARNAVSGDTTLRERETITVALPVLGTDCGPDRDRRLRPNVGFLVRLTTSDGPVMWGDRPPEQVGSPSPAELAEKAFLRMAFEKLRAQSQQ